MANYCPITNLNTIGKILERLAQNQLRRNIEKSSNMGSQQSANRVLHSTETAMTKVMNDLSSATDRQNTSTAAKFDQSDGIIVSGSTAPLVPKLRVLGVTVDSELSFDDHVADVVQACNYHIWALRHIRSLIDRDTANTTACCRDSITAMPSRSYCIADHNLNSLARVVASRHTVHRLPSLTLTSLVAHTIEYKVASLSLKVQLHQLPTHWSELVVNYAPARKLTFPTRSCFHSGFQRRGTRHTSFLIRWLLDVELATQLP